MNYIGASINTSATIYGVVAEKIENGAGKAVKFDGDGKVVLCSAAGEAAIGVLIMQTPDVVAAGDEVTIQIKDIGPVVASGAIALGAEVTVDANGKIKAAASGNAVLGQAMTSASADGDIVQVQITKTGYKA